MTSKHIKILLLGNSAVGKTSLLMRYTKNEFQNNYISTSGYDCITKKLKMKNMNVVLQITDICGQERFKSISQQFYNKVDGFIFVFDVTNNESFQEINNWLTDAQDKNNTFDYVIVGNKIDLKDSIEIKREDVANSNIFGNAKYFETSAKNNINVREAFEELTKMILNRLKRTGSIADDEFNTVDTFSLSHSNHNSINEKKGCCF